MKKPQQLVIPLNNEKEKTWTCDVITIIGDLALHNSRKDPKALSITHVPTLLHLEGGIPPAMKRTKKNMVAWMSQVQCGLQKDWLAMRKFTSEDIAKNPGHTQGVRDRIRKHCLETLL